MPKIIEIPQVRMDADRLWQRIGAFAAVGEWHPMVSRVDSEGDQPGSVRTAYGKDGSTQVERLLASDAKRHTYRYAIESTPMPVRNYVGELRVEDSSDGTSMVIWSARFDESEGGDATEMVRGFLKAGVNRLRDAYDTPDKEA